MPLTWIVEGTDLSFVDQKRPDKLEKLLRTTRKNNDWTGLFARWHASVNDPGPDEMAHWKNLVDCYEASERFRWSSIFNEAQEKAKVHADLIAKWDGLIRTQFQEACDEICKLLEKAKIASQETAKKAREGSPGRHTPVKPTQEMINHQADMDIARLRSTEWERAGNGPATQEMTLRSPARMEAALIAFNRMVKPKFADLYTHYCRDELKGSGAVERLDSAHEELCGAETLLHDACLKLRNLLTDPKTKSVLPHDQVNQVSLKKADEEALAAWVEYSKACTDLGKSMFEANADFVVWASQDTEQKLRENYGTAHPKTKIVLDGLGLSVTVLTAMAQCLGLASGPAVLTVTAALRLMVKQTKELAINSYAHNQSLDMKVILEHLGRKYPEDPTHEKATAVAERISSVTAQVAEITTPAMYLVGDPAGVNVPAGNVLAGASEQLAHFGEHVGEIAVDLQQLLHPDLLTDTADREELLAALKLAGKNLASATPTGTVDVLDFDSRTGIARVAVNGEEGTLRDGRFVPDNRRGTMEECMRNWARSFRGVTPGLRTRSGFTFAGKPLKTLVLQKPDGTAAHDSSDIHSTVHTFKELDHERFHCWANASSGMSTKKGKDFWEVEFTVNPEGEVEFVSANFQWYLRYEEQAPHIGIFAYTEKDVATLRDVCGEAMVVFDDDGNAKDGALSFLPSLQSLMKFPDGHLTLDRDWLWDSNNQKIIPANFLPQLGSDVILNLIEARDDLESGVYALICWNEPVAEYFLGHWQVAHTAYTEIQDDATSEEKKWAIYHKMSTYSSPGDLELFNHLLMGNMDLAKSILELAALYPQRNSNTLTGDEKETLRRMTEALDSYSG
ncbi:hypothetical protein AB0N09_42335 [Streptomyces erythrochromogenes]|uniref:hypothetical protein n=1 Tax=Streptomyces erythrochromogenes TaxID=285574 RepID=UPI0034418CE6